VHQRLSKAEISRRAVTIRRDDVQLTEYERFCPYDLAREHGVDIYALEDLHAAGCPAKSISYFKSDRPEVWSAALVPVGTGQLIVENTAHAPQRRRSNIAHELAHLLLEHQFNRILFAGDPGKGCRNPSNKDQEWEADLLGAELLIPIAAARRGSHRKDRCRGRHGVRCQPEDGSMANEQHRSTDCRPARCG